MAGLIRQLPQIFELGAAITLAEGVSVIDVADDLARLAGEGIDVEVAQIVVFADASMDVCHAGFDILVELAAVLGDFEGADLAGLFIDILKQMPVDGFGMVKVEIAGRRAFALPLQMEIGFGVLQYLGIGDAEPVTQHLRARNEIGVIAAALLYLSAI